ncbi:hypothetical protein N7517_000223 [Penicillium concentricum]|uniref:Uncharacterized protein n=1 Tax=Penicillium concentricum TaxID=293559 RepID=A0A9W9SPL7_9EURO|nr:uncharacterized protein N7517_000223 [Penicillium concentricum]KAJ5382312.1 hypothetical protein N7517_000223 [Penicillium concentricum]
MAMGVADLGQRFGTLHVTQVPINTTGLIKELSVSVVIGFHKSGFMEEGSAETSIPDLSWTPRADN